jgi:hypothetical protein
MEWHIDEVKTNVDFWKVCLKLDLFFIAIGGFRLCLWLVE